MPKQKETERQVRWNVQSDSKEPAQPHTYFFVIINETREINRIEQKILGQLRPVDEFHKRTEGNIQDGREKKLKYRLISMKSSLISNNLNFPEIYNGTIIKDRELYERERQNGLEDYIDQRAENNTF